MVIVDTSVWIDIVNGVENSHTDWFLRQAMIEKLALTDLILTEVLQGTRDSAEFNRTHQLLQSFTIFSGTGESLAVKAAHNYRDLRARGITVRKTIDCIIATFCLQNDHALLHHDRDFHHFERELGLKVVPL